MLSIGDIIQAMAATLPSDLQNKKTYFEDPTDFRRQKSRRQWNVQGILCYQMSINCILNYESISISSRIKINNKNLFDFGD